MSGPKRYHKPFTFTLVTVVGLLVGIVGLIMLLLGIGVISPTSVKIPGIDLDIQSATPGIIVMLIGFTTALVPVVLSMLVSMKQAEHGQHPTFSKGVFYQIRDPRFRDPPDDR